MTTRTLLSAGLLLSVSVVVAGCEHTREGAERDAEKAAERSEQAAERTAAAAREAGRDVEHAAGKAADAAREAGDKVADATREAAASTAAATRDATQAARENVREATAAGDAAQQTSQIKAALMADRTIDSTTIDIDTDGASKTVVLKGRVRTAAEKASVARIAADKAPGYRIVNQLEVRS